MSTIHKFLVLSSLKLTTKAPENVWLEDDSFPFGMASWQVRTVSFRKCACFFSRITLEASKMMLWKGVSFQQWQFWV